MFESQPGTSSDDPRTSAGIHHPDRISSHCVDDVVGIDIAIRAVCQTDISNTEISIFDA